MTEDITTPTENDTEGHGRRFMLHPEGADHAIHARTKADQDEDDTEGHGRRAY